MWRLVIAFVLAAAARAGEPDAATAHPLRWSDPNGTPAGTRRSACLPLTDDVEEAWSVELPGAAVSPIIYWEREAYLVCLSKEAFTLVAIDVFTGKLIAKKRLPKGTPKPLPVVWDRRLYLQLANRELGEFRRTGRTFNRVWVHKLKSDHISNPIVFENEVYLVADGNLVRLQPRARTEVWSTWGYNLRGRPALYGANVYVLGQKAERGSAPSMHVFVFERRTGKLVTARNAAWYANRDPPNRIHPGLITVSEKHVVVRGPAALATERGTASHVIMDHQLRAGSLRLGLQPPGLMNYPVEPAATPLGMLVLARGKVLGWAFLRDDRRYEVFVTHEDNPGLFDRKHRVAPTVLGDIVYFGAWAADIRTRRVLWRLPVGKLTFPAVPLDRMVLVIDGKYRLRAFRARGSKS